MNVRLRQPGQKSFSAAGLAALSELLFLLTFAAYLVFLTLNSTMFKPELPGRFRDLLLIALFMTGSLKLTLQLAAENSDNRKAFVKHILAALLAAVMWLLVYRNDRYKFLLFLAVLTAAFVGTDYRKALKVFVVSVGTVVLSAVLCSFSGSIPNLVYDDTIRLRSSWGIGYPTDFSAYLLFLCLIAWVAWRDLPDLFFLLPGVLSLVVAKVITGTNTAVICCILFLAAVVLSAVLRNQQHRVLDKLIHLASTVSFPLLGIMMIAMTWAYHEGNAFAQKLDIWNHNRLKFASSMYDEVGLSLFGTPFRQAGAGGGVFEDVNYHFVDCSYLLILLRYGVVTLLVLALLWVLMTFAAAKLRDRRLLLAFMVIAVHCVSEHHYTDLNYNPFLVMPFSLFLTASTPSSAQVPEKQSVRQKWTRAGLLLAVSSVLVLALILAFPRFTTLCTFLDLGSSVRRRRLLFAAVFTGLLLLLLFADACTRLLAAAAEKKKAGKSPALLAGVLAVFFLGGLFASNTLLDRAERKYHDMLESERPAVEAVQRAGCSLLVDNLPELYRRTFGSVDRSLFHGEDLARQKNLAVITDADRDLNTLIKRGFLYAEISDSQAIYTDSHPAIEALRAAGYHLRSYFSHIQELDLNEISWAAYGEPLGENTVINLSARGPIKKNVKIDLNASTYRITYNLKLMLEGRIHPAPDDLVCTLFVTCYPDSTLLARREVLYSEFGEDGICMKAVDISVPNIYNTEFLILPNEDINTLLLEGISYQKTAETDIHRVYDDQSRIIKERFYDPESGVPFTMPDGSQAIEYSYDQTGDSVMIRYLDAEGNVITTTEGYAEKQLSYNENRQVIWEKYYDADGKAVNIITGYAMLQNVYDAEGELSLTYFYDAEGNILARGSSNFHEYLTSLLNKNGATIFLSVRDDGTAALTKTLLDDLKALGIRTDLSGKTRNSYYAVISPEEIVEELSEEKPLTHTGTAGSVQYTIISAGYDVGDASSIVVNGVEYSPNVRGMNIVVVENGTVVDAVAFDTCSREMAMIR